MAGYVMAGSAVLGAYGAYQSGQYEKEYASKKAAIAETSAKSAYDYSTAKAEYEAAQNAALAESTRETAAATKTTAEAAAETTYGTSIDTYKKKLAAAIAKGSSAGFNINAGSYLSALTQDYDISAGVAAQNLEQAGQTSETAYATAEARAKTYDVAGKINLEEEKLALSTYGSAMQSASLLRESGKQAETGSYWTMAAQAAKAYGLYDYASSHGGKASERLFG